MGLTLGSDGDAHLRRKVALRGEQRQRLPPVHEGSGPLFAKPPGPSGVTLGQGGPGRFVGRPQPRAFQNQPRQWQIGMAHYGFGGDAAAHGIADEHRRAIGLSD